MNLQETTTRFDFALEFPQNWQECLLKIKKDGFSAVMSYVYWGLHESSPGIRDFSKSSKLKLEKFLQVASHAGLKVDLVFGFMPSQYTFPEWVKSLPGQKALVPAFAWDGISGPYFLNEVPSLENNEVANSFLSFFSEALTFLPLYKEPEGSLRNVYFDAGIYHFNQSITDDGSFSRWLKDRYGDIVKLNAKYQTSFNNFSNAGSKTGFRVLLDKRPWPAAFDYKSARNAYLVSFNASTKQLSKEIEIKIKGADFESTTFNWSVAFDSVFVEGNKHLFPFSPEALVLPQSVLGFRFLQSMYESLIGWGFTSMPLWSEDVGSETRNTVVINGKYLSNAGIEWLRNNLKNGSQLLFPFGIPQFNEEMKLSNLLDQTERETVQIEENIRLQVYKLGTGRLVIPEPHCPFDSTFQTQMNKIILSLEENKGS